ncbi:MAG: hypothetical protein OEY77_08810, partial [Nitrospira sp.]|nr:hypothetical protein [Nitrospira sp.]
FGSDRHELPVAGVPLEDFVLDLREVTDVALSEFLEWDLRHFRIHVVHVVSETSPDANKGLSTGFGDDLALYQLLGHIRTLLNSSEVVAVQDEVEDALGHGLRDHDGTEKVPIPVEVEAFRGSGGEVVVGDDPLVLNLDVAIYALLKRVLEFALDRLLCQETPELLVDLAHSSRH